MWYLIGNILGCLVLFVGFPYLVYRVFKWRGKPGKGRNVAVVLGVGLFLLYLLAGAL